jgi:hypothetical protein
VTLITQACLNHIYSALCITEKSFKFLTQGSVLGRVLYLIYTSDLLISDKTTATLADDTAILATHDEPAIASIKLQATTTKFDDWVQMWRIKINESKPTCITFSLCNQKCPTVQMGTVALPQKIEVKYLCMHLDRWLIWAKYIKTKRKQLNLKAKQMHWLFGRRSFGPTEFSYGGQPPIPTSKSSGAFNPRLSDQFWTQLGT